MDKADEGYRDYANADAGVRRFYEDNHRKQTLAFALDKKDQYGPLRKGVMGVWECCENLDALLDESDPDTNLSQLEHCLQTAESIRADGHPDWFVLAGLVHDLGKALCVYGEPQWAVTGDTFPLGCAFSDAIVYPEYFAGNPDASNPGFSTKFGIYRPGCGLVTKDYLPEEALYMIRYHSFYAGHSTPAYDHLKDKRDFRMFEWVRKFNRYDLYTKHDAAPNKAALRPYYEDLIARYFPDEIPW